MITEKEWKFAESGQEALKLQIALERYFVIKDACWKERYGEYLKQRIRPAMMELIKRGELDKIEMISQKGWFSEKNLDAFFVEAVKQGQTEIQLFLLELKKEKYGFSDRDFSL